MLNPQTLYAWHNLLNNLSAFSDETRINKWILSSFSVFIFWDHLLLGLACLCPSLRSGKLTQVYRIGLWYLNNFLCLYLLLRLGLGRGRWLFCAFRSVSELSMSYGHSFYTTISLGVHVRWYALSIIILLSWYQNMRHVQVYCAKSRMCVTISYVEYAFYSGYDGIPTTQNSMRCASCVCILNFLFPPFTGNK